MTFGWRNKLFGRDTMSGFFPLRSAAVAADETTAAGVVGWAI